MNTYEQLNRFLRSLKLSIATNIRDSQNYIHASTHGLGKFGMDPGVVGNDLEQRRPLLRWIKNATKRTQSVSEVTVRPTKDKPMLQFVGC